jgi:serine/threonine-protein kinase
MTSTAQESPPVPEIGKYQLIAELARGGMGNVYLAAGHGPGGFSKLLVVKELKPQLADDETYVAMFLDEARLAARLGHPNIVQTNEVGSDGTHHYMVMEFLDGRSLHRIAKRLKGGFPLGAQLRVISEALVGLHYAHELRDFDGEPLGIVHRDVSPLNLFVTFAGEAKVLDFGIAKTVDSSLETKMGVLKGRVAYMAPEQAKGAKVDRRADIYSVGVMLWEAAAGRRLWPGLGEVEILTELVRDGAQPLRSVRPEVPKDLDRICARAMAYDREQRYPTAAELLHDLEAHLNLRGDVMSMREVGAMVAQAFVDERRKMNAVIDEALTRMRSGPRSGVMPTLQAHFSGTPSNSFAPSSGLRSFGSVSPSAPATSTTLGSAQLAAAPRMWTRKRMAVLTAAVGALVFGLIVGGALRTGDRTPAQPAVIAKPAAAPAPHAEPELVDLVVRVSPPSAQISIDGTTVLGNPFHARYPKDKAVHRVVTFADGFEAKVEDVSFANDVSIDVSLNRRVNAPVHPSLVVVPPAAAAPRATKHSAPPLPPATTSTEAPIGASAPGNARIEISPVGGRAPLRPIATSNPYGNP